MEKCLFSMLLFFCVSAVLSAQDISVSVTDRDLDIPLEGAMISLVGTDEPVYTDSGGHAVVALPDNMQRFVLLVTYPGYQQVRLPFSPRDGNVSVEMLLSDMVEGEEMLVERQRIGKSDEKVGESVVLDEKEMESTANIGVVEDVMSSIKTLPGVGYTGSFNAMPAIRGGYPNELGVAMDGVYMIYPFHWGGAFSIFNPNMVESAKLSHGVYSARYGRALSGLLEITTKTPDEPSVRFDGSFSTTSVDAFLQTPLPFGEEAGLFAGGKITYLDSAKLIAPKATEDFTQLPYIRDFYAKMFTRPGSTLELTLNTFLGTDGLASESGNFGNIDADGITTDMEFDYDFTNAFAAGGFKWTPSDTLHFDALASYSYLSTQFYYDEAVNGSREYSDEFINLNNSPPFNAPPFSYPTLSSGDSYVYDDYIYHLELDNVLQQGQFKFSAEKLTGNSHILSAGTEFVYSGSSNNIKAKGYYEGYDGTQLILQYQDADYVADQNKNINPALYMLWEYGNETSRWSAEAGLRAEHYYMWGPGYKVHSRPVLNPRLSASYKLLEDQSGFDNITMTFGTGLFSNLRTDVISLLTEEYAPDDWEISPDWAMFNVAGVEFQWDKTWKASFETYYRYYLSRLVFSQDIQGGVTMFDYGTDGNKGHSAGFDVLLQKKISRKWDGYLSYSFNWSRFYNQSVFGTETEVGEIWDQWYYPYYHRFHNLNLVFNWRFKPGWTFSVISSLASGSPRQEPGEITAYPAWIDNNGNGTADKGEVLERYSRTENYSDSLRNGIAAPVDLRIAYGNYYKDSQMRWEFYFALEDAFVNIYTPEANSSFNVATGEEQKDTSADFNIGIPIPSIGFKLSY